MAYLGFAAVLVSGLLVYWGLRSVALAILRVADVLYLAPKDEDRDKVIPASQVFRRTGTG